MAEALVSVVMEQLASIIRQTVEERIRLIAGAEQEVEKLQSNFRAIQAVLADAETKQVKHMAVRDWLDKLKDTSYDIEDVLDEWNTEILKLQIQKAENASLPLKKVCCLISHHLSCFRAFVVRYDFAVKIKNLEKKLDIIAQEKDRFNLSSIMKGSDEIERQMTTSFIDLKEVHGRDEDKNTIIDLLLSQNSQEQVLRIISVVGMGGIGKTTLARLVFNDEKVITHFEKKVWVCVSEPFDEVRIAKAILESLTNDATKLVELETLLQNIRQHIEGKKFFLVLDDVWTENPKSWEQLKRTFKRGSQQSRILLTTRNMKVAEIMETTDMISLGTLSWEKCWSLFRQIAFWGKSNEEYENLKEIGEKIVRKCKGLPLAVKCLGSLLRFKRKIEEWQNVLDSEVWELKEVEQWVFQPLLLSYYDLPPMLKQCFSYCAIFPKDCDIKKDELIKLWMAQDLLRVEKNKDIELVGEENFETLAMRSFFQDFQKDEIDSIVSFKLHDLVHDFAQFLTRNECYIVENHHPKEFESESSYKNARCLRVILRGNTSFPNSIYTKTNLRCLMVDSAYKGDRLDPYHNQLICRVRLDPSKLFNHNQLICLRILELTEIPLLKVPNGMGKLIHLRYLKLTLRYITKLPKILCELYNLQTLDLTDCYNLGKLPQGIGKLVNLRHLTVFRRTYIPESVKRLTNLRTISGLFISETCDSLGCLRNINHLRGVQINGLGDVKDVEKAKAAKLNDKNHLNTLRLNFNGWMNDADEVLLETLQPHPNLTALWIVDYCGRTLCPLWITSMTKLRLLSLDRCLNCEHMPTLGKLPSLESLFIGGFTNVKRVGNEFLGIESEVTSSSSTVDAFPKLKTLKFRWMRDWEEWNYDFTNRREEEITIMPCLDTLLIDMCYNLKSMPNHLRQMKKLKIEIMSCPHLEELLRADHSSSSQPVVEQGVPNPYIQHSICISAESYNHHQPTVIQW